MTALSTGRFRLADRTAPEAAELLRHAGTVIVPLGACEQHGPGMALRTDTTRAEKVADLVADRMNGGVVVSPAIPVGVSEHHMAIAGTLTFAPKTLIAVVEDIIDSLSRHKVRRVFVLTGHGGNNSTVDVAIAGLRRTHPHLLLAWSPLTPIAAGMTLPTPISEVTGHCGESETSQAMVLDPTLVHRERLERGAAALDDLSPAGRLSRTPGIHFPQRYDQLSHNGTLGDGNAASEQLGTVVVERIVERLVTFLTEFNTLTPTDR